MGHGEYQEAGSTSFEQEHSDRYCYLCKFIPNKHLVFIHLGFGEPINSLTSCVCNIYSWHYVPCMCRGQRLKPGVTSSWLASEQQGSSCHLSFHPAHTTAPGIVHRCRGFELGSSYLYSKTVPLSHLASLSREFSVHKGCEP